MKTIFDGFFLDGLFNRNLGRHVTTIKSAKMAELALRAFYMMAIFHILASCLIKLSFAFTLLRFLVTRPQRLAVYATMLVIIGFSIAIFFYRTFVCSPVPYVYETALDPYMLLTWLGKDPAAYGLKPKGHCHSLNSIRAADYSSSIWAIVVDLVLGVALPLWLLKGAKIKPRLKIVSGLLLGLGALASVATMTRLSYMHLWTTLDYTYYDAVLSVWSSTEIDLCIIATNIATLKPLATRLAIFGETTANATPPRLLTNNSSRSRLQMRQRARQWLGADLTDSSGLTKTGMTSTTTTSHMNEEGKSSNHIDGIRSV